MSIQELSKQMKNSYFVNYAPINFYKSLFGVFIKVFLVFFIGWLIFFIISNGTIKEYLINHLLFTSLIFIVAISIALLQNWFNSKIYIYQVLKEEDKLIIKWQELKKFREVSIPIKEVTVQLQPSGKNTPYLEVRFKTTILKQTYYPGWDKETMTIFVNKINKFKAAQ